MGMAYDRKTERGKKALVFFIGMCVCVVLHNMFVAREKCSFSHTHGLDEGNDSDVTVCAIRQISMALVPLGESWVCLRCAGGIWGLCTLCR